MNSSDGGDRDDDDDDDDNCVGVGCYDDGDGRNEDDIENNLEPYSTLFLAYFQCRDSLLVQHRTRDRKVASSNPVRSDGRIFFFGIKFVCWLLFGVRSTSVLPGWHIKDPGQSVKSAGGRFHLNTHTPLTQRSQSGLTMPLSRYSVRPIRKRAHTQLVREHSATVVSAR